MKRELSKILQRFKKKHRPKISIIIPFRADTQHRRRALRWLLEYWECELPDAQIIVSGSTEKVFCKTEALNRGVRRAKGKVIVILDADAYLKGSTIDRCADRILEDPNDKLWFIPYRRLYRLNEEATNLILDFPPCFPIYPPTPPPPEWLEDGGIRSGYGHRYGAMIMIFPREALEVIGCFDERFKGWGGEDISLLIALDTLYGKHKTTNNSLFHLYHPKIGDTYRTRKWKGQKEFHPNDQLATEYHKARNHPSRMREIMDEACVYKNRHKPKYRIKKFLNR